MFNQDENQSSYWDYQNPSSNSMNGNNNFATKQKPNKYEQLFDFLPPNTSNEDKKRLQSYFDAAFFAKDNPVQFLYNVVNKKENLMDTSETVLHGGVEYNKGNKENFIKILTDRIINYNIRPFSTIMNFYKNYDDMNNLNIDYSDKYFHSKANFKSAQYYDISTALTLDILKEVYDIAKKNGFKKNGKPLSTNLNDSLEDLKADFYGLWQGALHPLSNHNQYLKKYRIDKIPDKY